MYYNLLHFLQNKASIFFKPSNDQSSFFFFFRVMVSLVALFELISIFPDLYLIFGKNPELAPHELYYLQTSYFNYFHPIYQYLDIHNLSALLYPQLLILYVVILILLMLGCFTRPVAFLAIILQLFIYKSFSHLNYGYDNFVTMSLFYCFFFPTGKSYSLDNLIFPNRLNVRFNYMLFFQLHLTIAYFYSGLAKALDWDWFTGMSIWTALASVDNEFYAIHPFLLMFLGTGTVIIELLHPILIWFNKTRRFVLIAIILMHISIAFLMDLFAFSAIMIVWNLSAFGNLNMKSINPK